ncbi:nucleotidyltransferase family protein [Nocardioides aestuarii]|uniref:Nucleotidyltransferase family protein n=1 Tax=Nocardioides aestuarii TaxID=252231 RepID=A0ABW4TIF2_9ACTN
MTARGLLLAAGAGSRMGRPKALVDGWLAHGAATLLDGGCSGVTVVLGAAVDDALALLPAGPVDHVVAEDWAEGMSASLRVGLSLLSGTDAEAAVVLLVDLPDVGPPVVSRLLAGGAGHGTLARAAYAGKPGHPVLLGRDHWDGVVATARGDEGARAYLAAHDVALVECGDLATGEDVDRPLA